jgi:FMN-dependent NADH-azoreductase
MARLLHIIASPRGEDSRTLKISGVFLEALSKKYPDCQIDEVNIFEESLQPLTVKMVYGKYILLSGGELTEKLKDAWKNIERHIERFLAADYYLISVPMWNFNIPYALKHYIDIIVQPKYLFRYTAQGVEGLAKNKKMVIVTSRGGDYGPDSPSHNYDFQEPYLRAIFGFVGITDITFINAQPMDMGQKAQESKLHDAMAKATEIAQGFVEK